MPDCNGHEIVLFELRRGHRYLSQICVRCGRGAISMIADRFPQCEGQPRDATNELIEQFNHSGCTPTILDGSPVPIGGWWERAMLAEYGAGDNL